MYQHQRRSTRDVRCVIIMLRLGALQVQYLLVHAWLVSGEFPIFPAAGNQVFGTAFVKSCWETAPDWLVSQDGTLVEMRRGQSAM